MLYGRVVRKAAGDRCRSAAAFWLLPFMASCGSCGEDSLIDVSCKPGDPAQGRFDEDLVERCDNAIDDNCDGKVNEGCSCLDGETFTCGVDVGICGSRTVTCVDGAFPECVPRVAARDELCNGEDDDCDGEADEGIGPQECPATMYGDQGITDGTTPCHPGLKTCEGGRWSSCVGAVGPEPEQCNGRDDDCDGSVDDDPVTDGDPCGPAYELGQCIQGEQRCHDSESICIGAVYSQNEICDAIDNDCDGLADEELYRPCETRCGGGLEQCRIGRWQDCSAPVPQVEVCDSIDNDCDGEADEGCPCLNGTVTACFENIVDAAGNPATCGYGTQVCQPDGQWGPCIAYGTTAELCNAWDDDCDGAADGFSVQCGDPTLAGIGECRLGETTCTAGAWGECVGGVAPLEEVCDALDNDCDGETDEELDPHDKVDMMFLVDISGSMCPYSSTLAAGYAAYVGDFVGTDHRFGLAVFPGYGEVYPITVVQDLTDAATFSTALSAIDCDGGGFEPTYDALEAVADDVNAYGISWRSDAYPYMVMVTDEPAQTWDAVSETDVASHTANCRLPGCATGDRIEIFIITNLNYVSAYDEIVYHEMDRMFEIAPPSADRYTDFLRSIFAEVCLAAAAP